MADTPLEAVRGWSPDQVARMKAAWITTAEQVVALSATASGLQSLSEQLQMSRDEARRLVDLARSVLSAETRAEMEQTADTSDYGLGAVRPPGEEKNR
jgi:hypothetical protein